MANTELIKTFCNEECQKPFAITKMLTIKVKQGIDKTYFRCTHCKHEYIAYYASAATKKLQKKMRALLDKLGTNPDDQELLHKISLLKAEIKKSMDETRLIAES